MLGLMVASASPIGASAQDTSADAAGEASADAPALDPEAEQNARDLFSRGARAFEAGRYEEALGFFQDSYRISQRHLLLYNIGQAQDRLRRDEEALATFQRYLEIVEEPLFQVQVESRIRNLEASVARRAREQEALEASRQREEDLQHRSEEPTVALAPAAPAEPVDEDDGGILSKWWFWTIVGVVVVGGVAIGVGAAASGGTEEPVAGDIGGVVRTLRF